MSPALYCIAHSLFNASSSFNSDDAAFINAYPEANLTITALLRAIRARKGLRRNSSNGTPEERDSRLDNAQTGGTPDAG